MKNWVLAFSAAIFMFSVFNPANARGREPYSGKKGGISHCAGTKFVCNDGSYSASKKICRR